MKLETVLMVGLMVIAVICLTEKKDKKYSRKYNRKSKKGKRSKSRGRRAKK